MRLTQSTETFQWLTAPVKPERPPDLLSVELKELANHIVRALLEDDAPAEIPILEATVFRPRATREFIASYIGPDGYRVYRTTGCTDRRQAMFWATYWEARARRQRARRRATTGKPRTRVSHTEPGTEIGPLTQREVAHLLGMSERGVRAVERRAFRKLFNNPQLRELWRQYLAGDLEEDAAEELTAEEIQALFDVAQNPEELLLVEKVVRMIQA